MSVKNRYKVIACSVFRPEFEKLSHSLPTSISYSFTWLESGLHRDPGHLRSLITQEIEILEHADESCDAIVLLYGLCSNSIIGLSSEKYPIVVARAHDCITLFLGSNERYKSEFAKNPGTYWFTRGFINDTIRPGISDTHAGIFHEYEENYERYLKQYGDSNLARYIVENNEQAWICNYSRGVFIQSGLHNDAAMQKKAQSYCEHRGWQYEEIQGHMSLLYNLLTGNWDAEHILIVPPAHRIVTGSADEIISVHALSDQTMEASEKIYMYDGVYREADTESEDFYRTSDDVVIGIDAGGTYTDAVIVSLADKKVLAAAKSPTTHHDYAQGIEQAIQMLPLDVLKQAKRLSVSTTLATNAIAEQKGYRTGLILIGYPPETRALVKIGQNDITIAVDGRHDIDGNEQIPLDENSLIEAVKSLTGKGIEAFAVSSYLSPRNPDHEIRAVGIISQNTAIPVISGHTLTDDIDAVRRAQTALLNARLLPIIEKLLQSIIAVSQKLGLPDDIRLVTSEGTLINVSEAILSPIRLILSGPAASIQGVRFLTTAPSAVMIDMGGTTTDIAVFDQGTARRSGRGAIVDGYKTSISATDMYTTGQGGDSWIRVQDGTFTIGPRRVLPISRIVSQVPDIISQLERFSVCSIADYMLVQPGTFYVLEDTQVNIQGVTEYEAQVIEMLRVGPISEIMITDRIGAQNISLLGLARLEDAGIILRTGLTPTDILVCQNRIEASDDERETVELLLAMYADRANRSIESCIDGIWRAFHTKLAAGIITEAMGHIDTGYDFPGCRYCEQSLETSPMVEVSYNLKVPIIGIGAPARLMLEGLDKYLTAEQVLPEWAEVANAVGAAAAVGMTYFDLHITATDHGKYILYTPSERIICGSLDYAKQKAIISCKEHALSYAETMGYNRFFLKITSSDRTAPTSYGVPLYIDTTITAELTFHENTK